MKSTIYKEILHADGEDDNFLEDVVSEKSEEQILKVFVIDDEPFVPHF